MASVLVFEISSEIVVSLPVASICALVLVRLDKKIP